MGRESKVDKIIKTKGLDVGEVSQYSLYIRAHSFERLSILIGEILEMGYYIVDTVYNKAHNEDEGDLYEAIVIALYTEEEEQ